MWQTHPQLTIIVAIFGQPDQNAQRNQSVVDHRAACSAGPLAPRSAGAEPPPLKRVLLLLPFEASRPGSAAFLRGIQEGLKASYSGSVDVSTENVGPVPPEPENFPARIDDWIAYKYSRVKFDAIVAVTFPPSRLAETLRDRFWPGASLLLVLIDEETLGESRIDPPLDSSDSCPEQQRERSLCLANASRHSTSRCTRWSFAARQANQHRNREVDPRAKCRGWKSLMLPASL